MVDFLEKTEAMIKSYGQEALSSRALGPEGAILDLSLSLEDLHATATRLKARIRQSVKLLTGKDSSAGAALKKVIKNEFDLRLYKCRALLLRLAARVRDSLLAAVPYKKRISHTKQGGVHWDYIKSWRLITGAHETDVRILQLMDSSAGRRLPSIKQLARKFNTRRDTLAQEAATRRLKVSIPLMVDVNKLFDTDANPGMWMEEGHIELSSYPPAYLTNVLVQQGIGALLVQDRGEEESNRLRHELGVLVQWVSCNLQKVDAAISNCQGKKYNGKITASVGSS
jgi:hypothetical protein